MDKITLTLQGLSKRLDSQEKTLNKILDLLNSGSKKECCEPPHKSEILVYDLENDTVVQDADCNITHSLITDEHGNVFVKYDKDLFYKLEGKIVSITSQNVNGFKRVHPQLISRYKNSIDENFKLRSIVGVAPNCNQLSFNKSTKFAKSVGGEHLSGTTHLYLMLLHIFTFKHRNNYVDNESYNYDVVRDCGWRDTNDDTSDAYLGLSQIANTGYNFVDIRTLDKEDFDCYKELLVRGGVRSLDDNSKYFAITGGYSDENNLFYSRWLDDFNFAWSGYYVALRLCKNNPIPEEHLEEYKQYEKKNY